MSYGCYNRAPLKTRAMVQDGWYQDGHTRTPRMISITDPMSKDCRYDQQHVDSRCAGCSWIKAQNFPLDEEGANDA